MNDAGELLKEIDQLIAEAQDGYEISNEALDLLEDISIELEKRKEEDDNESKKLSDSILLSRVDELISLNTEDNKEFSKFKEEIVKAVKEIVIDNQVTVDAPIVNVAPPEVNVTVPPIKIPEIKQEAPIVNVPDLVKLQKPEWIDFFINSFKVVIKSLDKFKFPTNASDAIPVRLSDGQRFYRAVGGINTALSDITTFANAQNERKSALVDSQQRVVTVVQANALSTAPIVGQVKMTGSAIRLNKASLVNGVIISAKSTNTANVEIGLSNVSTTQDGTGNGYILEPGASVSFAVDDCYSLYVIGTSNDVISYAGS